LIVGSTEGVKNWRDPLDVEVGQRVRAFRLQNGLSQQKLADQLGITFQQVQRYENGTDRIGAGRLQVIATILRVPTYDFFPFGRTASRAAKWAS
jgi:transcriptional regulator with XRE-family HTH domain